jgi:hypothetical protein
MTSKQDLSEDQWAQVVRAPFVADLAVTLSDPGGPIDAGKEQMAAIRPVMSSPTRGDLLTDVALDVQGTTQQHEHPLKGYRPAGARDPREALLEELRATRAVVGSQATAEEATAFSLDHGTEEAGWTFRDRRDQPSASRGSGCAAARAG